MLILEVHFKVLWYYILDYNAHYCNSCSNRNNPGSFLSNAKFHISVVPELELEPGVFDFDAPFELFHPTCCKTLGIKAHRISSFEFANSSVNISTYPYPLRLVQMYQVWDA